MRIAAGMSKAVGHKRAAITLERMDSFGTASPMAEVNLQAPLRQLYDQDFARWVEETSACLRARDAERLDWESLLEEIEGLGKSEKRELESRLSVLLNHLLKRCYVELPDCYRGWQLTILEQRNALKRLLKQSPSLKPYLEAVLDEVYQDALAEARAAYPEGSLPQEFPFSRTTEDLLSEEFWAEGASNA